MAKIPRQVSRQITPSGRTGGVITPSDIADTGAGVEARGLGALGGGISDISQAFSQIKVRENQADDLLASDNITNAIKNTNNRIGLAKKQSPDPKTWAKIVEDEWDATSETIKQFSFNDPDEQDRALIRFRAEQEFSTGTNAIQIADRTTKIAVTATGATLVSAISLGEDTAAEELAHKEALKNKLGDDDLVNIAMKDALSEGEKQRVSVLTQQGQYNEAKELVLASKAFNATEANATIQRIDNTERHVKRKTLDLNFEADMAVNDNFVELIANKSLLPDEIAGSRLPDGIEFDKLTKDVWQLFASGSNDPAPKITTPDGYATASDIVLNFPREISREAAYSRLLNARYIEKEITDAAFTWAINHISNPYPRHVGTDIESVTQNNSEVIAKGGFLFGLITSEKEKARAVEVNTELIRWVDSQIADKKEPTRDQMYQKSAEIRAGDAQLEISEPVGTESGNTITMLSPSGKPFNVPIKEKQLFLDNGFTE